MSWLNSGNVKNQKSLSMAAFAAFFLCVSANQSGASELSFREKYLTLRDAPKVTVVEESSAPADYSRLLAKPTDGALVSTPDDIGGTITEIGQIINLGKEIWDIIAANKPVVNVATDSANALPKGAAVWTDLQGWQAPASRLYRFTYSNLFGMDVVDFSYRVIYSYGGNVGGRGKYLANVTIVPADLSVLWGYTFDAKVSVPSVVNAGSVTDPMAAVQLLVDWKISTVIKHNESSQSYYVRGDGAFTDLSGGN